MKIHRFFRDDRQKRLFVLSFWASVLCCALVAFRAWLNRSEWMYFEGHPEYFVLDRAPTFIFLVWNLFLAWLPYVAALFLSFLDKKGTSPKSSPAGRTLKNWGFALPILAVWLVFFPNAPYIVTDLVHLRHRPPVPMWFDLIVILSTALTGLAVGLFSLSEVHFFLRKRISKGWERAFLISAMALGGFGVWLGRDQRWNSWDILTNPIGLFRDISSIASEPRTALRMTGVTILVGGFLGVAYLFLRTAMDEKKLVS